MSDSDVPFDSLPFVTFTFIMWTHIYSSSRDYIAPAITEILLSTILCLLRNQMFIVKVLSVLCLGIFASSRKYCTAHLLCTSVYLNVTCLTQCADVCLLVSTCNEGYAVKIIFIWKFTEREISPGSHTLIT